MQLPSLSECPEVSKGVIVKPLIRCWSVNHQLNVQLQLRKHPILNEYLTWSRRMHLFCDQPETLSRVFFIHSLFVRLNATCPAVGRTNYNLQNCSYLDLDWHRKQLHVDYYFEVNTIRWSGCSFVNWYKMKSIPNELKIESCLFTVLLWNPKFYASTLELCCFVTWHINIWAVCCFTIYKYIHVTAHTNHHVKSCVHSAYSFD